jgi:hypothetical protein
MVVPVPDPYHNPFFDLGPTAGDTLPRKEWPMASPQTDAWWAVFLDMHGRDSEEEKAFLGFLQTQGLSAMSSPDVLALTYSAFLTFVEESHARDATSDPPPEAKAPLPLVPRSAHALPELEKPMTAATRPPEWRDPEAAAEPSPLSAPSAGVATAEAPAPSTTETPGSDEERGRRGRHTGD